MPNWCWNSVIISGRKDTIELLFSKIKSLEPRETEWDEEKNEDIVIKKGDLLFESLIGLGDIDTKKYKKSDWYEHNMAIYGTKWDIHSEYFDIDDEIGEIEDTGYGGYCFHLSMQTAWCPPFMFLFNLSKLYDVMIQGTSEEGGDDYYARYKIANGDFLEAYKMSCAEGHYEDNIDYFWDSIVEDATLYMAEENYEDAKAGEELLRKQFDFVTAEDLEIIIEEYNKQVKELEEN